MDDRRGNIFIFGLIAFVLIAIIVTQLEKRKCDPLEKQAEINREYIKDFFSISEISIKEGYNWPYSDKLINEPLIIKDPEIIEEIRYCLVNLNSEMIDHTFAEWIVNMTLKLANNEEMKIDIDKSHNGSHITAGIGFCGNCPDQYLLYSDSLLVIINRLLIEKRNKPNNK